MLDLSDTPPPLHYSPTTSDQEPSSTRDSTPVSTPVGFAPSICRKSGKEKDLYFSWHRKPIEGAGCSTSLYLDSALLEPDIDDPTFPLFGSSPPNNTMAGAAAPIDIATRQSSSSPRGHQPSNLTSALQGANGVHDAESRSAALDIGRSDSTGLKSSGRHDSVGTMMGWANSDKQRRESIAASLTGGMSWGGISVGSWIRDDIIMAGTSPFTFNSPSYHSSSYLPKLEANFMKDFSCCGMTLGSLHDLLQHYEEAHAQRPPQSSQRPNQTGPTPMPDSRAAVATNTAASVQQQAQQQQNQNAPNAQSPQAGQNAPAGGLSNQVPTTQPQGPTGGFGSSQLQSIPDMDTVEDMEMDDAIGEVDETTPPPPLFQQAQMRSSPQTQYSNQNQPRVTPLNMNMMQGHQGLRNSQPSTPIGSGLPLQNNPTVSSVNTPSLMPHPLQQQQQPQYRSTPDSSAPGTPGELNEDLLGDFGDMSMQGNGFNLLANQGQNFGMQGFGANNDMLDLCIDEPAKRLFSPTGGLNNSQQYAHFRLGSGQYGPNSEIAQRIRQQQMLAGVPDTTAGMMPNEEPKPFRCPVIGCEKAYKNQNGLKYHKAHGHNNQRLQDNADGTFSIVNPETSAPYPGTLGMEKEKPYKCDHCGKRYKNLNGLKYHKSHSPPCNPELQLQNGRAAAMGGLAQGQNLNPSAAGFNRPTEAGMV